MFNWLRKLINWVKSWFVKMETSLDMTEDKINAAIDEAQMEMNEAVDKVQNKVSRGRKKKS